MAPSIITVLITTYNYGRFLEEAIDSILAQEFPVERVQILVVDDGSTDDTSERVRKYGSRIEYFCKPNGGQASALNFGIGRARGEIICLMDADDLFLPVKLRRIADAFERAPELGMVYHQLEEWYVQTGEHRAREFVEVSGDIHKEPERFSLYLAQPTSAISFRRSALDRLTPIPEDIRMLADCYPVSLIPFVAPILALPEILSAYRIHGKNCFTTGEEHLPLAARMSRVQMWQTVIEAMRKWLASNGYTRKQPAVRSLLDRWSILLDREEFAVAGPGRVRFFGHLFKCYRHEFRSGSWGGALVTYLDAFGALIVGHKNFPRWHKRREELTRWVARMLPRTHGAPQFREK
jgi:glycosyltransferase involved in cell wall biosynthesis